MKKLRDNKMTRQITYKTIIGILPILQRFSADLGVTDINELAAILSNMTVDELCDYKFKDTTKELTSE